MSSMTFGLSKTLVAEPGGAYGTSDSAFSPVARERWIEVWVDFGSKGLRSQPKADSQEEPSTYLLDESEAELQAEQEQEHNKEQAERHAILRKANEELLIKQNEEIRNMKEIEKHKLEELQQQKQEEILATREKKNKHEEWKIYLIIFVAV